MHKFLGTELSSGLVHMSAASSETFCKKCGKLIGMNFFYAASYREFYFALPDVVAETYVYACGFKRKITHDSENVRIARLRLYYHIFILFKILIVNYCISGHLELIKGNVRVAHFHNYASVNNKLVLHILIKRVGDFGEFVCIGVQTVVKSCCKERLIVYVYAFLFE